MKPKSTLRSYLALAGSSLLAVSAASAEIYYWDSDDGTAGFGTAAGTWAGAPGTGNKWSTDSAGTSGAVAYPTTTSDDLFFGTPSLAYTGTATLSGTVNAKSIYLGPGSPGSFGGTGSTINFGTVGTFENARAGNSSFPATTTLSGAATSLTWKMAYSQTLSLANISTNSVAGQNILTGPGRLGISTMAQLGTAGQSLAFDGGVLRFINNFPIDTYPNVTAFSAVHPISFNLNKDAGFDNQNNTAARQTFTVDVPLALGTGGFSVEGNGGAVFILSNTGNSYSGATKLIGANLQISDAGNIGSASAPFYFGGGTLKVTGTGMTTLGTRPVVIKGTSSMRLDIVDASNVFTVGQSLTDNDVPANGADGIALGVPNDVVGIAGVVKTGLGTLILSGNSSYTGATTVTGGKLLVNGSISTSVLTTVQTGATLGGSGTVGALTVAAGGIIAPGNSPDGLDVNGNYAQAGAYQAEITANTLGNGTTGYDQVNVTGTVNITGGSLTALFSGTGYAANDLLFILLNDLADPITGTYTGLAQGAVVGSHDGFNWQISYTADSFGKTFTGGDGNDIALMAVAIPEPATALLGALGLLALLRRRR